MKTAAIIGAGISGLASAHVLSDKYDVTVYEKSERPGGLIRCEYVNGVLYHCVGGHVFNSRREDVLNWFWSRFDKNKDFTKAIRKAVVALRGDVMVDYPIENHIFQMPREMANAVVRDLLEIVARGYEEPRNFDEFLRKRFGHTLYREYFGPYNQKIWQYVLDNIPLDWLEGKLPMPTVEEIVGANIFRSQETNMVHSTFNYPRRGGSQYIADTLARGLKIIYNTPIQRIQLRADGSWLVDGSPYDLVVFCGNIKQLPDMVRGSISWGTELENDIFSLRAHGTTSVLCEVEPNPYSWIYLPSEAYGCHRMICTGNFAPGNAPGAIHSATVEFTGRVEKASILQQLTRLPYSPRYLAHHYEPYTYPIQNANTRQCVQAVKDVLAPIGIHLIGRFAEWEYYNMDAAIGAAIDQLSVLPD